MWTQFWDMHSGGGSKEKQNKIYIEADQKTAEIVFQNRFGHNPNRVTCTCCGPDYSIVESPTIEDATEYNRGSMSVEEYKLSPDALFIFSGDIKPEDIIGELKEQGYVWRD